MPPGTRAFATADPSAGRSWSEGIATAAELAASCSIDLGFEQYRFPGFPVPDGETPFSYLSELCWAGARRRYHPLTPAVVKRLAHELDVIERAGLAEFFLICWDLMRFAKEQGIPAQGRGSATSSIVSYTLGISRVEPIGHNLLFERFINPGRTTYPDVDIDFSSERREEVIQYIYRRYGPEHTGMVCNLVTYRARSAVREVGYALGFPRPLVDRVAKALETYDSVMVRRDLEADGGFAEFFRRPGEGLPAESPRSRGGRGPRLRRRDGPAEHADAARREGAALAPAAEAGRPERTETVRLAPRGGSGAAADRNVASTNGGGGTCNIRCSRCPDRVQSAEPERGFVHRIRFPARPPVPILRVAPPPLVFERNGRLRGVIRCPTTWRPWPRSGPAARPTTRGGRETPRPASPGYAPVAARVTRRSATGSSRRRSSAGRRVDPESGSPSRRRATEGRQPIGSGGPAGGTRRVPSGRQGARAAHSSVARVEPEPPPQPRGGSTVGLSDWERWLEFCARIDGFPRHSRIHSGGMLVTAAPLIDIAPLERATMPDRVVVQFDKRDVESLKLIKLDLLGLGMLAAIDETLQLIEHDCAVCLDLDRLPEEVPEVFAMLQAADTVGVFQVESRAQMQTLPKSRPQSLDDLVVEVAIIRPGPIQGNAVHPYLRRKQGLEPVTYLHPSLEPILRDSMGVILYQEQVMRIAIEVGGFSAAESDGFRRAMGTWRSTREMEKLHRQFVEGCLHQPGMTGEVAEELFRQVRPGPDADPPKSRPQSLDDLVVEVAIIRPGPIQGNAVHPYLRRKQGLEPVTYLHPSLEPILRDSMGVILYQEQVMRIAIEVGGSRRPIRTASGGRWAPGARRREMEKLHRQFFEGCIRQPGMTEEVAEELFRQVAAFASFGFAKSHAAAFARTAYESAFLKLFYPAQFLVGLINAQPMGFYPVEVLVNDAKRHGVAVLPVDINASSYRTTTEWAGQPGWVLAGSAGDDGSHDPDPGEPLPEGSGIAARPRPVRSPACVIPSAAARERWIPETATGWGVRLGLGLVKGIGEQHEALLDRELARGPYRSLPDVVERTGLPEEVLERLIRTGALDSLSRPRRELLWQLREVAGASRGRVDGRALRGSARTGGRRSAAAGRPMDLRLPANSCAGAPRDHRVGADRRRVRGHRPRCAAPGGDALPPGAGPAGRRDQRVTCRTTLRAGSARWPGRDPPAPDDGQGDGLPGPGGRDRDGQRHALAGHLGPVAQRRPAPRPAAGGWAAPARGRGGQRGRRIDPAAPRGGRSGRGAGPAAGRAPARSRRDATARLAGQRRAVAVRVDSQACRWGLRAADGAL